MPWFHGKISREDVNRLLTTGKHPDGTYLVRESTNYPGDYTLCVYSQGIVDHYHIKSVNGKISVDDEVQCDSLEKLIKVRQCLWPSMRTELTHCVPPSAGLFFFLPLQHYEQDENGGLSHRLTRPLIRQNGKELKVDRKALEDWEIPAKSIIKGQQLGSGQFGGGFSATSAACVCLSAGSLIHILVSTLAVQRSLRARITGRRWP